LEKSTEFVWNNQDCMTPAGEAWKAVHQAYPKVANKISTLMILAKSTKSVD
jgi:hypothetical protein